MAYPETADYCKRDCLIIALDIIIIDSDVLGCFLPDTQRIWQEIKCKCVKS